MDSTKIIDFEMDLNTFCNHVQKMKYRNELTNQNV